MLSLVAYFLVLYIYKNAMAFFSILDSNLRLLLLPFNTPLTYGRSVKCLLEVAV